MVMGEVTERLWENNGKIMRVATEEITRGVTEEIIGEVIGRLLSKS